MAQRRARLLTRCQASCARSPRRRRRRPAALRGGAGRDDAAPALRRRDSSSAARRDRANLMRLWEACQTPDFRKTTQDEHTRLVGGDVRAPDPGRPPPAGGLDAGPVRERSTGSTATSTRCRRASPACARSPMSPTAPTGSPIRPAWQGRARALEDRLSDTLHQSLMQRFVDRRTSTLLRALQSRGPVLGGIAADGEVTVEGHVVGRLTGVHFEPERGDTALETRALRGAVERGGGAARSRAGSANSPARATRPSRSAARRGRVARRIRPGEIVGGDAVQAARAPDRRIRRTTRRASARRAGSKPLSPRRRAAGWRAEGLEEAIADGRLRGLRGASPTSSSSSSACSTAAPPTSMSAR